ncbi:MAG: glycerophosphodiester phosphodiesterase [Candidatus Promineifilaceae bacterium]|nr:glycerophosphodiester phosphodiesterase [Candidatus Promineifilaceae bacterium]
MRKPTEPFASQGGPVLLAHRGFSGRFPENTMLAFEKAADLPIDGLEMDIYATRDDVLVVAHDDSLERTTDGQGRIEERTLAELQTLDAGYRFSPDGGASYPFRGQGLTIPTMDEVLGAFTDLWINVDIKHHEPRVVALFCDLIERHNAAEQLCVGSFSHETVSRFRAGCPEVVTLATNNEIRALYAWHLLRLSGLFRRGGHAMQVPPQQSRFGLTFDLTSPRFIQAAHDNEMAIHLWTVNESDEMKRYLAAGVDGLITNFPDRALRVTERL